MGTTADRTLSKRLIQRAEFLGTSTGKILDIQDDVDSLNVNFSFWIGRWISRRSNYTPLMSLRAILFWNSISLNWGHIENTSEEGYWIFWLVNVPDNQPEWVPIWNQNNYCYYTNWWMFPNSVHRSNSIIIKSESLKAVKAFDRAISICNYISISY